MRLCQNVNQLETMFRGICLSTRQIIYSKLNIFPDTAQWPLMLEVLRNIMLC